MRLAAAEAFELDQSEHVGDARRDLVLGQSLLLETEGDIALDREMRKQSVALEHHIDGAPVRRHRRKIHAVEQDAAAARLLKTGDKPQQRCLAAARRTKQREEFALINFERKLIDGENSPKRLLTTSIRSSGCKLRSAHGSKPRFANPELDLALAIALRFSDRRADAPRNHAKVGISLSHFVGNRRRPAPADCTSRSRRRGRLRLGYEALERFDLRGREPQPELRTPP